MTAKRPSPAPRLRRVLLGGAALLALGAGLHGAAWAWLSGRVEEGAAAWIAQRRAEGWQVSHGPPRRGGWPFRAEVTLPALRLERPGFAWGAERVALAILPPAMDRLRILPAGRQRLRLGATEMAMETQALQAFVTLAPGAPGTALPAAASASADRVWLDLPGGAIELVRPRLELDSRAPAAAAAARPPGPGSAAAAAPPPQPGNAADAPGPLGLRASAEALLLPADALARGPLAAVLGPRLSDLRLDLALSGPLPPAGLPPARRAERWRDMGGLVALRSVSLAWGQAAASASATLALDAALQPAGAGTLRLAGAGALLDAAVGQGLLPPRNAGAARLMLQMMQRRPAEGGPPVLEVPLELEAGVLSAARFPLLRLPPLSFP